MPSGADANTASTVAVNVFLTATTVILLRRKSML
jgi:hypothetical protein